MDLSLVQIELPLMVYSYNTLEPEDLGAILFLNIRPLKMDTIYIMISRTIIKAICIQITKQVLPIILFLQIPMMKMRKYIFITLLELVNEQVLNIHTPKGSIT